MKTPMRSLVLLLPFLCSLGCGAIDDLKKKDKDSETSALRSCTLSRGMWVWNFIAVLDDNTQVDALLAAGKAASITDMFVFVVAQNYTEYAPAIRAFNAKAAKAGIKVWGLEGYRGYFSDSMGPAKLYAAADAMIAFNTTAAADEKFVGFQTDMEPQDDQGDFPTTFHNGIPDSQLSTTSGGAWQATQADDREKLLEDWISIETALREKLHAAPGSLRLGAAMPSWADEYYHEPVSVIYKGEKTGLMKAMMDIVDDYVIMSYNTDPTYVAARLEGELAYADTLPFETRPHIFGALETHEGAGYEVSYADTPVKNSRAIVLRDAELIHTDVMSHPSYCGIDLHDWLGWKFLNP